MSCRTRGVKAENKTDLQKKEAANYPVKKLLHSDILEIPAGFARYEMKDNPYYANPGIDGSKPNVAEASPQSKCALPGTPLKRGRRPMVPFL